MKISNAYLILFILLTSLLSACGDSKNSIHLGVIGDENNRIKKSTIEHVVHISVDGLHPAAITTLGITRLPGLYFIRQNGSYTDNARTDDNITYTLPNHTSQFTGRFATGLDGHNWEINSLVDEFNVNLHSNKGSYITSIFDMVHDFGLSTALYTGKSKFSIFNKSWGSKSGGIDRVNPDSGRNKIDSYEFNAKTNKLVDEFIEDLTAEKYNYAFLHLKAPDSAGHEFGWSLETNSEYLQAVEKIDANIISVINLINTNMDFKNSTVLIITADHGGQFGSQLHFLSRDNNLLDSGVIPFYIYGVNVPANMDLYSWNPETTFDPGDSHPYSDEVLQPIRNGDTANLVMELLGLPNVPQSTIDNLGFPW